MRWLLIILWCTGCSVAARASVADSLPQVVVRYDTASHLAVRHFSAEKLDQYRRSPDFQYERNYPEALSWWDRLKAWFWDKVASLIHFGMETGLGRTILILALIGLIVFIAFKMAGANKSWFLGKHNSSISEFYANNEDVHAIDFDSAINAAVQQHNYRLAVRLWYLMTLKKLTDKELILWKAGKTNYEYVRELGDSPYARDFIKLTNSFEYCWYGESQLKPADYESLSNSFSSFNQHLS